MPLPLSATGRQWPGTEALRSLRLAVTTGRILMIIKTQSGDLRAAAQPKLYCTSNVRGHSKLGYCDELVNG